MNQTKLIVLAAILYGMLLGYLLSSGDTIHKHVHAELPTDDPRP